MRLTNVCARAQCCELPLILKLAAKSHISTSLRVCVGNTCRALSCANGGSKKIAGNLFQMLFHRSGGGLANGKHFGGCRVGVLLALLFDGCLRRLLLLSVRNDFSEDGSLRRQGRLF
jgi:hypothetical protein